MFPNKNNWVFLGLRCHRWFMNKMGLKIGTTLERVFLGLAFAGEAGELANKIKKLWRDEWRRTPRERKALIQEIKMEMADCYAYLHHMANSFEVDLDVIAAEKTHELMGRWPQAFEPPQEPMHRLEENDG